MKERKDQPITKEEERLIEIIREVEWGEISNIKVQNGKPTVVEIKKTIKI